jgi:hypothetical protein
MVDPDSDPDEGKARYAYDPHLDPALQFDVGRAQVERIIDDALESGDENAMRGALLELKRMAEPYLNWTGKAERTSFDIDTVSCSSRPKSTTAWRDTARKRELVDHDVRMLAHAISYSVAQCYQNQLSPLPPRKFHGRNEVAVGCYEDNHLRVLFQCQARDVEADAHVDTLLPNVRFQGSCVDLDSRPRSLQYASLESPAFEVKLSESQRKERLLRQSCLKPLVPRGRLGFSEVDEAAAERFLLRGLQRSRVIEIDSM